MANVITLPNGITIESSDPVVQNEDLVISREAYAVLENFSAESIYEAANFIMSQEAEEKERSFKDSTLHQVSGQATIGGIFGTLSPDIKYTGKKSVKNDAKHFLAGGAIGALGGAADGLGTGATSSLVNKVYYKNKKKNLSRAISDGVGGTIYGAARGALIGGGTKQERLQRAGLNALANGALSAYLGHRRDRLDKAESNNKEKAEESFVLPSGRKVYIV